jgi:hypothetical protein
MAFTFLVEDGTGLSAATSYVSVEDADDIITVNIHADSKWSVLDQDQKERLLSWASRTLDAQVAWKGTKVLDSALRWPRIGVVDRDGVEIPDDTVPRQLKVAVASMATYLIDEDRFADDGGGDALKRIKADVVEIEFQDGSSGKAKFPAHMHALLDGLGIVQSGRPRFKKIIR